MKKANISHRIFSGNVFLRRFSVFISALLLLALCSCNMLPGSVVSNTTEPPAVTPSATPETLSPLVTEHTETPVPTTAAPTIEQTPSPTPEPPKEPLYVPDVSSGYYDSFFDKAVFVGDSVSQGLQNYVIYQRGHGKPALGEARFLAIAKYSLKTAAADFDPDKTNLTFQGEAMSLEDCLFAMGAEEMYIMLGLNDWAGANVPDSIKKYTKILEKVLAKNPDITIYIELCTPITKNGEKDQLNNESMDKFNEALKLLCEDFGIEWIDVSTPMKDENNYFRAELSRDDYVHMSNDGLDVWIDTLRGFARDKYIAGDWESTLLVPEDFEGVYMTEQEAADYLAQLEESRQIQEAPH